MLSSDFKGLGINTLRRNLERLLSLMRYSSSIMVDPVIQINEGSTSDESIDLEEIRNFFSVPSVLVNGTGGGSNFVTWLDITGSGVLNYLAISNADSSGTYYYGLRVTVDGVVIFENSNDYTGANRGWCAVGQAGFDTTYNSGAMFLDQIPFSESLLVEYACSGSVSDARIDYLYRENE